MAEKFVQIDGLKIRYLEEGTGPEALLLHGASLGSSADVWERNLASLASYGLKVIAYDQPGFGGSDDPADYSVAYRRGFILKLTDALGIRQAHLVGHSQAGAMAVGLAFDRPERVSKIVVLGSGSLLPPLESAKQGGAREGEEGTAAEPTIKDTRALLEHNLFNHSLITAAELERRHKVSVGKNFQAFLERSGAAQQGGAGKQSVPLWQRLDQVPVPVLFIYGKQDRGSAAERAGLAKQRYPRLNIHVIDRCKHLVQWDAASEFETLCGRFLTS